MSSAEAIAMDPVYETRQGARNAEYREAYGEWIASLPEDDVERLEQLGIDRPWLPGRATAAPSGDAAESPLAKCGATEPIETGTDEGASDAEGFHDLLRRLVGELMVKDNARLSLECLALVTGLAYCGDSMTEIARRHGVTRAAVSKRCVELTTALNLKPSRAMRSEQARKSHRRARLNHLRRQS